MTSVLEGMRGVYENKVWDIVTVHFPVALKYDEDYQGLVYIQPAGIKADKEAVPYKEVKPLLRFPDKDSEFWACDIISYRDDAMDKDEEPLLILIFHDGYEWQKIFIPPFMHGRKLFRIGLSHNGWNKSIVKDGKRLCSLYDPKALEFLPEYVVSKLKGEVR